jgi:hypothetical protein
MLENMTPEDRRTFVRNEMKKQEELELINMMTPNSKKTTLLECLKGKRN